MTEAYGLTQLVTKSTQIGCRTDVTKTSTLIDHIFTNSSDLWTSAISIPVGCSDHNISYGEKNQSSKKGRLKIIVKRSYKYFIERSFIENFSNICWDNVLMTSDLDN